MLDESAALTNKYGSQTIKNSSAAVDRVFFKNYPNLIDGDNLGFLNYYIITKTLRTILAMIANSAVQSSTPTLIHNAVLFIDNARYNQAHFQIGTPYLVIIARNVS